MPDKKQLCLKTFSSRQQTELVSCILEADGTQRRAMKADLGFIRDGIDPRPTIAFNPLSALKDPAVRDVFTQFIYRRFDTEILSKYYDFGPNPPTVSLGGVQMSRSELTKRMVDFLEAHKTEDPYDVVELFGREFMQGEGKVKGVLPFELRPLIENHGKIFAQLQGLPLVQDALPQEGIIADIGAGRNDLGFAIAGCFPNTVVIGTDVMDWRPELEPSERVHYVPEKGGEIRIDPGIIDTAIIKWTLHHMDEATQKRKIESIMRILKPGGRVIIIETLMADKEQSWPLFQKELNDAKFWPNGPWKDKALKLSLDYLNLTLQQQKEVLALEDYQGHVLFNGRDWMPLPFTYQDMNGLTKQFTDGGFEPAPGLTRVFGTPPILRSGPPSVRLVFEKPAAPVAQKTAVAGSFVN